MKRDCCVTQSRKHISLDRSWANAIETVEIDPKGKMDLHSEEKIDFALGRLM